MRQAGLEGRCQEALAQDNGARSRRGAGQAISSSATSGRAKKWTVAMSATSPTSRLGRAGPTWQRSSTWPPDASSAGLWPITCAANWSKTPSPWPSPTADARRGSSSTPTVAVSTPAVTSPSSLTTNGVVLSVGRKGECWDNPVAEIVFRHHPGRAHRQARRRRHQQDFDTVSRNASRAGTTPVGCTRRSATSALPNTKHEASQRRPSGGINFNTSNPVRRTRIKPTPSPSGPGS